MARTTYEPMLVHFLTTIASSTLAPTVAEMTAGTDLTPQIPVDGVAMSPTQNNASQAMLGDAFVAEEPGTWGTGAVLTFVRDDTTSLADTFDYRTSGYLVTMPYGGTIAAGVKVDVYPVTSHKPVPLPSAENEYQKLQVTLAVTAEPAREVLILA